MRIVEQSSRMTERTNRITTDYPTESLFQVFVNGRLQDKGTYSLKEKAIDFGFDCLVPGDLAQLFYLI